MFVSSLPSAKMQFVVWVASEIKINQNAWIPTVNSKFPWKPIKAWYEALEAMQKKWKHSQTCFSFTSIYGHLCWEKILSTSYYMLGWSRWACVVALCTARILASSHVFHKKDWNFLCFFCRKKSFALCSFLSLFHLRVAFSSLSLWNDAVMEWGWGRKK